MNELHVVVSGRVQGVMFRDFTSRKARALGLTGWVKNLPTGTVEVLAQGEREALETFLKKLHRGPFFARVDSVTADWRHPEKTFQDFELIR